MGSLQTTKSALGIGIAVFAGLAALWLLTQVVSAFVWLFYLVGIVVVAGFTAYAAYELWTGWTRAG